ncbi:MAG: HD domain-containing phosphohydrolase [Planctomycetota bacterium]
MKVLVADDESAVRSVLGALLEEREDCESRFVGDGEEAFREIAKWQPDVLITDLNMPRMSGEELTSRALQIQPQLAVLVETGNPTVEGAVDLMRRGVLDFVTKPFSIDDVRERIDRCVQESVSRRQDRSVDAIVESMLNALEAKDAYLRVHSERVAYTARCLGEDLGVSGEQLDWLEWSGLVHDVGKIGTPDLVLHKPGKLSEAEFDEMKKHPVYSAEIVRPLAHLKGGEDTVRAIYHHHERIDGRGYPDGIGGEEIPKFSKIISVCDTYDAITSNRPYRDAQADEKTRGIMIDCRGTQLEAEYVDCFLGNLKRYKNYVLERRND